MIFNSMIIILLKIINSKDKIKIKLIYFILVL